MKSTVSMAVLGIAVASTSAMAGVYISPADRAARQQEREALEPRDARGPGPSTQVPRGDAPRGEAPRGDGRGERRGEDRHDERRNASDRNVRDDRGYREPRPQWQGARPRDWDDRDRRGWDGGRSNGWRDERGRDWHYSRDWYDRYRADHFRYDRGRYLARQRFSIGLYYVPRGYAPRYWQRGQWLPSSYYVEPRYHLVDYWRFDLYDPPFGARWVRVGADALLIDFGSGEVLDVVFELFW